MPVIDKKEDADVVANMRSIVPYTIFLTREMLKSREEFKSQFADQDLWQHQPLEIKAVESMKSGTMTSYKPPWTASMARNALQTAGMVEASANALWLNPHPPTTGDAKVVAGDQLCWKDVEEAARRHFSEEAYQVTHAVSQGVSRIVFPVSINAVVDDVVQACHDWFPSTLKVLSGHVYLYGLYLGMYKAFQQSQWGLLASLWQCCLTTTICCRAGLSVSEQAILTMSQSESAKLNAQLMSDSFVGFAYKALLVMKNSSESNKLKVLTSAGVRYNSAAPTKQMVTGILIFDDKITDRALEALRCIERKFGREVLTAGYHKLSRVSAICATAAPIMLESCSALMEYVLEYLKWGLQYDLLSAAGLSGDALDKGRDGKLGVVHATMGRRHITNLILGWVQDLGAATTGAALAKDLREVMKNFESYRRYEQAFPVSDPMEAGAAAEAATQSGGGDPPSPAASQGGGLDDEDPVEALKRQYNNKACHAVINFMYDLLACQHDQGITEAMQTKGGLKDVQWMEVECLESLREIHRLVNLHKSVVETGSSGPPETGSRTLQRYVSESAEDPARKEELRKERHDAWRQAVTARKKFVHTGWQRVATKQQLQAFFAKTPVFSFNGKPGESHRVFLFSSELYAESATKPWVCPADLAASQGVAEVYFDFMSSQVGPCDVLMIADGRSRANRKKIEKKFESARHQHEVWIIFRPTKRLGRKVAFAADNKEMVLVSMPLVRTQLSTAPREDYNQAGEESTHETTYTGVDPAPWSSLPLITAAEKEKVQGSPAPVPQEDLFDTSLGMPLYWQERKTVHCWKSLLKDVGAKAIFDLTPGSGACGRAAMEMGVSYSCLARSAEHCSWLQNIWDRQALRCICEEGGPLHQQDLSQCIKEHFAETLDQLNQMDDAEEADFEGDLA